MKTDEDMGYWSDERIAEVARRAREYREQKDWIIRRKRRKDSFLGLLMIIIFLLVLFKPDLLNWTTLGIAGSIVLSLLICVGIRKTMKKELEIS